MVAFNTLLAGFLLAISPAAAAVIEASFGNHILFTLRQLKYTKVGARVTCERKLDYTHNDQRELVPFSESVTITTDRCKRDPMDGNKPGKFKSYELILFKDDGQRLVCGEHSGTGKQHGANENPYVNVTVETCRR